MLKVAGHCDSCDLQMHTGMVVFCSQLAVLFSLFVKEIENNTVSVVSERSLSYKWEPQQLLTRR